MAKQAKLKDQYYKLGEKANSFVDNVSKSKILLGQVIKVEGNLNKSGRLKAALAGGHIVRTDEEDYNSYHESLNQQVKTGKSTKVTDKKVDPFENDSDEIKQFRALSDAKKRKAIKDEYELEKEDEEKLKAATGEAIVDIYKELIAEDEDEASDDEDSDDTGADDEDEDDK